MRDALRFAGMAGSSIATPGGAGWIADFLNAAYYARRPGERDAADLRLAHTILATRWVRKGGRRLGVRDLPAFHRAFGNARLRARGRLDREALIEGGARLLGDWFPEAALDPARRAHGVAFPTAKERREFDPGLRRRHAALRQLTPPKRPAPERRWATYAPVRLPDPDAALALLRRPERWPDVGSAGGRFTALNSGGLRGQTFEILVVAQPMARALVATRGYVTCTAVHGPGATLERCAGALDAAVRAHTGAEAPPAAVRAQADNRAEALPGAGRAQADDRAEALPGARRAHAAAEVLPPKATPLALIELTTHAGHFMGRAISHLLVFESGGAVLVRDVGCWDPLPRHLRATYAAGGHAAQVAFWGGEPAEASMLAQLARVSADPAAV